MNKYINAKDLLNEVWAESVEGRIYDGNTYVGTFNVVPIGDITEIVNHMSSEDVVEVKHGEWKTDFGIAFTCSACDRMSSKPYDFCPNCGADMRKEK